MTYVPGLNPPTDWHFRQSRRIALWLLAIPLIVTLAAFAVAVATTLSGEMAKGSPLFYTAAASYSALVLSAVLLPCYLISLCWYAWWTRHEDLRRLRLGLWLAPLVAALFAWFPSAVYTGPRPVGYEGLTPLKTYLFAASLTLIIGLAWSVFVRTTLRIWRKV